MILFSNLLILKKKKTRKQQKKACKITQHAKCSELTALVLFREISSCNLPEAFQQIPLKNTVSTIWCHLLITFANNLDPDQAQQNVGPDQDPTVKRSDGILERIF